MKLQIDRQRLRIRIDEDELARLLGGATIETHTQFAGAFTISFTLASTRDANARFAGHANRWEISLPHAEVEAHAARLPTRDGLNFTLAGTEDGEPLELLFDVDVRDSARRLKSKR
jgi:hypothetical protein